MHTEFVRFKEAVVQLANASEALKNVPPHREFSFENEIKRIQRFSRHASSILSLSEQYKEALYSDLIEISQHVERVTDVCGALINFSVIEGNVRDRVEAIKGIINTRIIEARNVLQNFAIENLYDFIEFGGVKTKEKEITNKAEAIANDIKSLHEDLLNKRVEIDSTLNAVKMAAGAQGVSVYAALYEGDKKLHTKISIAWLVAGIISFGCTVYFSLWSFMKFQTFIDNKVSDSFLLQYSLSKLLLTGVFIFISIWLLRMFKIERHLSFVNRQKENALNTFQAFFSSGNDPAIKDAILMETTKSIFSSSNTGLVSGDAGSEDTTKIIEIVKSITSK